MSELGIRHDDDAFLTCFRFFLHFDNLADDGFRGEERSGIARGTSSFAMIISENYVMVVSRIFPYSMFSFRFSSLLNFFGFLGDGCSSVLVIRGCYDLNTCGCRYRLDSSAASFTSLSVSDALTNRLLSCMHSSFCLSLLVAQMSLCEVSF